ncbi:MAG: universal stress protein [Bacteroidota bacterium]|nr:universal stress protein [Bacteroidota bacterium]
MKDQLIILGSFDFARAQVIKSQLQAAKIECFPEHEEAMMSGIQDVVNIIINEEDAEKALKIVNNYKEAISIVNERIPKAQFPLKKILVAVDFSEHTLLTCKYAMNIAKEFNAEVKLVHAYENPIINSSPYTEPVVYNIEPLSQLSVIEHEAKKKIGSLKKELKQNWPEAILTSTLVNESPVEGILKASMDYKPGLIFIGHHIKGSMVNPIVSHTGRKVSDRTTIPVFVVPDNIVEKEWKSIKKVLYATDLDDQDLISVMILSEMIKPLNIEIHCVHVSMGAIDPMTQARFDLMKKELQSRNIKLKNVVCKLIVGDDIENTLETYLRNNDIDLISLTPHKRNLLTRWLTPSLTNRIVKNTEVPVLLFHD